MTSPNGQSLVTRYAMKNGESAIREPSAMARLRMMRVVTDCLLARARMLQMMKRFPGKPKRKTTLRMSAPTLVLTGLSTMVLLTTLKVELTWAIFPLLSPKGDIKKCFYQL